MLKLVLLLALLCSAEKGFSWGFYAHRLINYQAVFLLPPEMLAFYKPNIAFIELHAVDPDKRRYAITQEGPRHYIDMDHYGSAPYQSLPRSWKEAVAAFAEDSLEAHGIVPWWIQVMLGRLTDAFRQNDLPQILKLSAELGHYIADAHVPLHTSSNHNGQLTGQQGIHGFWESAVPELLAEREWDLVFPHAEYIADPLACTWSVVLESAAAADSVLRFEKSLSGQFSPDRKFSYRLRTGLMAKQYSELYIKAYDRILGNMIERRLRQSIATVASFWYTAWVNAGQPELGIRANKSLRRAHKKEFGE